MVYLDGVVGLNFLVDWCLLLGVNRLSGYRGGTGRAAAGAALGSGYAGMCVLPGFAFLSGGPWPLVSLGLMSAAAFGLNRGAVRRGVLFVLLSLALGGLVISADTGTFPAVVLSALILALLCRFGFQGKTGPRQIVDAELCYQGRCVTLKALVDTGNTLRDPVSGCSVLIADGLYAWTLAGLHHKDLVDPAQTIMLRKELPLRLIPYRAVGQAGLLLALNCDTVRIQGRPAGTLVAFSPEGFPTGEFRALTGGQYD